MTKTENLLVVLAEECGELTQAVAKLLRFGPDGFNPYAPHSPTNAQQLLTEYYQVQAVMDMLFARRVLEDMSEAEKSAVILRKQANVSRYEEVSEEAGRVIDAPSAAESTS